MSGFDFTWHSLEKIRISGRDAAPFLQGMVTNDVVGLPDGGGCYAFHLDPTGHILADMTILKCGAVLELTVEPGSGEAVASSLEQYRIMERCRVELVGTIPVATVWGGDSQSWAHSLDGRLGPDSVEGDHCTVPEFAEDTRVVRMPGFLGACYRWWLSPSCRDDARARLRNTGAVERPSNYWDAFRIRAGFPVFGRDFDAKTLAPETGQETRAIHYRKGCYIGQEIVARIDARGRVRRTLCRFQLAQIVDPGSELFLNQERAGWITSSATDPSSGDIVALGYLRHEFQEPGTVFQCNGALAEYLASSTGPGGDG